MICALVALAERVPIAHSALAVAPCDSQRIMPHEPASTTLGRLVRDERMTGLR
jgi:hypothetical protein